MPHRHQPYDRIIKENLQPIFLDVLRALTGLEATEVQTLYPEFASTIKRVADFVVKIKNNVGREEIIHIEFQSTNDGNMLGRMMVYSALLYEKYQLPVSQYVFYLGRDEMKMELKSRNHNYNYELIDLQSVSYKKFINSDNPGMVLVSILADFEEKEAEWVIEEIIKKIKVMGSDNALDFNKYSVQLDYLSVLRNLQSTVEKKLKDMALVLDIRNDLRFQEGVEEGMEKGIQVGIQKGIEKGKKKGVEEGLNIVALNMFEEGFGIDQISLATKLSLDYLKNLLSI